MCCGGEREGLDRVNVDVPCATPEADVNKVVQAA